MSASRQFYQLPFKLTNNELVELSYKERNKYMSPSLCKKNKINKLGTLSADSVHLPQDCEATNYEETHYFKLLSSEEVLVHILGIVSKFRF